MIRKKFFQRPLGLSSKLSSDIQNTRIAAAEFQNDSIEIIDSENLSTGIGLLVMKAVDLRQNGMDINKVEPMKRMEVKEIVINNAGCVYQATADQNC